MRSTILLFFFVLLTVSLFAQSSDSIYTKNYFDANKTKLYEEGYLMNEKREGIWKEYSEQGWLRFDWAYKNGLKNGTYKCYRKNGQVEAIGNYTDGLLDGTLKIYDEKNELFSESVWVRKKDGTKSELISTKYYSKNIKPDGTIEVIDGEKYIWGWGEKFAMPKDTLNDTIP